MADPVESLQAILGPRYNALALLGRGGMANVFSARDTVLDRDVAIKVIREELSEAVNDERFFREIEIMSGLTHPHITPLLDSGVAGGKRFYVMPLMEGETLRERLKREEKLGLDDCLRIAGQLAGALAYAHDRNIVHRDVKPSNIFIRDGEAMLSDFGIALALDTTDQQRLTESEFLIGTALYMSPEQASGRVEVDCRSDLYSLGCVLFEMLTGQPPFTGKTYVAVVAKHVHEPIPSAAVLRADLPIEVEEVVEHCLAKSPGDRVGSATELGQALEAARRVWSTGESRGTARTLRAGPVQRAGVWKPLLTAGVAALVAIGAWLAFGDDAPTLDQRKVFVFPLADRGGAPEGAGTAVAMLINNALTHADPLRARDAWQQLGVDERRDPSLVTHRTARNIALAGGAGSFITGGISRKADSVSILLVLHDTEADSVARQAASTGSLMEYTPDQIGLHAMMELLPALLAPGRDVDISFLLERDPSAVALWIQGDVEYRQARFTSALEHYGNAVAQDSLLGLAALMGAKTAIWRDEVDLANDLVRLALASDSLLPNRHRLLARGLHAYLQGRAGEAIEAYRLALEDDDEWSDAWMLMGEVYQHLLPSDLGEGDRAVAAFSAAARHDPGFIQPFVHLSEYSIRAGDTVEARERVALLRASGAEGSTRVRISSLMLDCIRAGPDDHAWDVATALDEAVVLEAAQQLVVAGAYFDCAEGAFRSVFDFPGTGANRRWAAGMGLQALMVAQGRDIEAGEVLDAAQAAGISTALFMPMVNVWAGADMYRRAESVDSLANALWGETFVGPGPLTLWVLGVWKARLGDVASLGEIRNRLHEKRDELANAETALMSDAIDGHYALARSDTVRALEIFEGLHSAGSGRHLFTAIAEPLALERLLLAEILIKKGEFERAYWTAAALDHPQPIIFTAFLPWSLAVRHRAAIELSVGPWRTRASEARARLERMGRLDVIAAN